MQVFALFARPVGRSGASQPLRILRFANVRHLASSARPVPPKPGKPAAVAPTTSEVAHAGPRVIYRGPPSMRLPIYYVCGAVFVISGLNFGSIAADYLSWPIISFDPVNNPPKPLPWYIRWVAGVGVASVGLLTGWYFLFVPSRMITRMTLNPANRTLTLRTAAPPMRALVPSILRPRAMVEAARAEGWELGRGASADPRERVVPLSSVHRHDGSAVSIGRAAAAQLAARRAGIKPSGDAAKRNTSIVLRLGGRSFGYQLEAANMSVRGDEARWGLIRRGWESFKTSLKGETDAGPEATTASAAQNPKDPWFLDRANFDRLIPFEPGRK